MSNDFTLSLPRGEIKPLESDVEDWRITFVDTGMHANLGQRLMRVRHLLRDEPMFLANYSDGLSDLDLADHVARFQRSDATATFLAVRPPQSFHSVSIDDGGLVRSIEPIHSSDVWVNGGYFCLRNDVFDAMQEGEELVEKPFQRLLAQGKVSARKHEGFWAAMDTFKDKITLDRMEAKGECPWMVWRKPTP
jgi:glucose-1-phosphate cytidylyltransferase